MINVQAPTSPEQHVSDQITTAMISILNFPKTATNTSRESLLSSRARAGVLRASACWRRAGSHLAHGTFVSSGVKSKPSACWRVFAHRTVLHTHPCWSPVQSSRHPPRLRERVPAPRARAPVCKSGVVLRRSCARRKAETGTRSDRENIDCRCIDVAPQRQAAPGVPAGVQGPLRSARRRRKAA